MAKRDAKRLDVVWIGASLVGAGFCAWEAWARSGSTAVGFSWRLAIGLLGVAVGSVGMAARSVRGEPVVSVKRANLCKTLRICLFFIAANTILGSLFFFGLAAVVFTKTAKRAAYATAPACVQDAASTLRSKGREVLAYGAILLPCSIAPFWGARWARGRIRRAEGKCVKCAYLLQGLTEPRCPECGTPFNPADLEGVSAPPAEVEDHQGA